MSLEDTLEKTTAALAALTEVTTKLLNLRVEGMAQVQAAAAPATKATKKTEEPAKATEPASPPPAAQISTNPEDRKPEGPTHDDMMKVIESYVAHPRPEEVDARKAKIREKVKAAALKQIPPADPETASLKTIAPEMYGKMISAIEKLKAEIATNGDLTKPKADAAATEDDDL